MSAKKYSVHGQPSLRRQRGFGMTVFVIMLSVIGLSFVLGYSGQLARQEANARPGKLEQILENSRKDILSAYALKYGDFDRISQNNLNTIDTLLEYAGISKRFGMMAEWTPPRIGEGGLSHRRIVLYFPTLSDASNPPNLEAFKQTGQFVSCTNPSASCDDRIYKVFDTLSFHKAALIETHRRMERISHKAQAYFKARMLQDPEQNVSVNYFRPPRPNCRAHVHDLPCFDAFTPIAELGAMGWQPLGTVANTLGLTGNELISAWGAPIEISNALPAQASLRIPPYTMQFRALKPDGSYLTLTAIQQL